MRFILNIRLYIYTTLLLFLVAFIPNSVFADTIIPGNIDTSLQVIKRLLITTDGSPMGMPIADLNSGGKIIFYPSIYDAEGNSYISIESDPIFSSSSAASISSSQISQWNNAFGRGNHASMGYLTTETDPLRFLEKSNYYTKNEVDTLLSSSIGGLKYKGIWDYSTGALPSDVSLGYFYKINTEGDFNGLHLSPGDMIIANTDISGETTTDHWDIINNTVAETDPVFSSSIVAGIQSNDINHWNDAYSRGNHKLIGYLTGEDDPVWKLEKNNYYTRNQIDSKAYLTSETDPQWNSDKSDYYTKNDINTKGYLTSFSESDPLWTSASGDYYTKTIIDEKFNELSGNVGGSFSESDPLWNSASSNYYTKSAIDAKGFLTSFNELDPLFSASVAAQITSTDISHWDSAADWISLNSGNILYFFNNSGDYYTKSEIDQRFDELSGNVSGSFSELDPIWTSASGNYYTKSAIDAKGYLTGANWNLSETTLNYMSGNVGIGTTSPSTRFYTAGYLATDIATSEVGFNYKPLDPPAVGSVVGIAQAGAGLSIGNYYYRVTFYTTIGETSTTVSPVITTTAGNQRVLLTFPTSTNPAVIGRKIYRTKVGGTSDTGYPLVTINNNTATTYTDSTPDTSLNGDSWAGYKPNTTSLGIAYNGTRGLLIDKNTTLLGFSAGKNFTSAPLSTFIGSYAGYSVTYGFANTIIGHQAGYYLNNGGDNILIGYGAGLGLTNGSSNIHIGDYTARATETASNNIGIGTSSLRSVTSGGSNAAFGVSSLRLNTYGAGNSAFGLQSLYSNTTGSYNIGIGVAALYNNTTGSYSIGLGYNAGRYIADGTTSLTVANNSVFIGYNAKALADNSSNEIVIGYNTVGQGSNTATYGNTSMSKHIFSNGNVGIGTTNPSQQLEITQNFKLPKSVGSNPYGVIYKDSDRFFYDFSYGLNSNGITPEGGNLFIGRQAGNFTMGSTATASDQSSYNFGIGYLALSSNTLGSKNTAIGLSALRNNTQGVSNLALSADALMGNTIGSYNTAIGTSALKGNTIGSLNTAIGVSALIGITTSNNNLALGFSAGRYISNGSIINTSSEESIFIGNNTRPLGTGQTNQIVIGNNAIGIGSNTITLGDNNINTTALKGNVGIGTITPSSKLDVVGDIELPSTGSVLLGEPDTEGTRRITTSGGALSFQVYHGSAWEEKSTIAP